MMPTTPVPRMSSLSRTFRRLDCQLLYLYLPLLTFTYLYLDPRLQAMVTSVAPTHPRRDNDATIRTLACYEGWRHWVALRLCLRHDGADSSVRDRVPGGLRRLLAQSAPVHAYSQAESGSTARQATVQPDSVASGYTLHGNKVNPYIYQSDTGYAGTYHCVDVNCTLSAEVAINVRENVVSGSSKRWLLTQNARYLEDPGGLTWNYSAIYYCAVNVSFEPDHYCQSGADASGTEAPMTAGEKVYKTFEKRNSGIVYPMVGIFVHFSNGVSTGGKFREWDTCNSSSPKLCAKTGTGA